MVHGSSGYRMIYDLKKMRVRGDGDGSDEIACCASPHSTHMPYGVLYCVRISFSLHTTPTSSSSMRAGGARAEPNCPRRL